MYARCMTVRALTIATSVVAIALVAVRESCADEASAVRIQELIANIGESSTNRPTVAGESVTRLTRPAMEALLKIGSEAEPFLITELQNPHSKSRADVALVLGGIRSKA